MKKMRGFLPLLFFVSGMSSLVYAQGDLHTNLQTANEGLNGDLMMVAPDPQALAMAATTPGPNGFLDGAKMIPFGGDALASMDPGGAYRSDFNQTGIPGAFGMGVGPFLPPTGASGMEPQTAPELEDAQPMKNTKNGSKETGENDFKKYPETDPNGPPGLTQTWREKKEGGISSFQVSDSSVDNIGPPHQLFTNVMETDGNGFAAVVGQKIEQDIETGVFISCFNCDLTLTEPSIRSHSTLSVSDFMVEKVPLSGP
ncbi:MAG TPA: hypothetical protein VI382_09035 [Candidatus Manganitrophaceae bacterium]|nr:hypothetical protein [Candidatus Manganitrophaceae bacterium]